MTHSHTLSAAALTAIIFGILFLGGSAHGQDAASPPEADLATMTASPVAQALPVRYHDIIEYSSVCFSINSTQYDCTPKGEPEAEHIVDCSVATYYTQPAWTSCTVAALNVLGKDGWMLHLGTKEDFAYILPSKPHLLTRVIHVAR